MAPKSKKKGVHTVHEEHPHVVRNRERRKAQDAKKLRRISKMLKSKRKSGKPEAVISSHETSIEENVAQENTDVSVQVKNADFKTGHGSSKRIPKIFSVDAILKKDETRLQSGAQKTGCTSEGIENETFATRKTIEDNEIKQSNLQKIALKASPKDLTIKKNLLQKKLETFETEKQFLDDQERVLAPLPPKRVPKDPLMAISGVIRIFDLKNSSESNKEEFQICSLKDSNTKILQITDNNVQISIVVFEGTQVICNRIERTVDYSSQDNLESRLRTFEDQTTVAVDKNVRSVAKKLDETLIDTSNLDLDNFELCLPTLEDQAAIKPDKDVRSNPEHNNETVNASSNSSQDGVESFPQISEDKTTVKSDRDVSSRLEHHNEISNDSSKFGRDDAESCPQTFESQYTIKSDEDVRSDIEQHDEIPADLSILSKDAKSHPQISEDASTNKLDKDVGSESEQHNEPSFESSIFGQDVELCPQTSEDQAAITSDKDLASDSKQHDKTSMYLRNFGLDDRKTCPQPIDRQSTFSLYKEVGSVPEKLEGNFTDSNLDQYDVESRLLILESKPTITSNKYVGADPEKQDETLTDPSNSENLSLSKTSKENVSSLLKSLEEEIREICRKFLEDISSACASFKENVRNNLKTEKE